MRQLTIPLKNELYEQFKQLCEQRGEPMTVHVRRYIIERLEQETSQKTQEPTYPEQPERFYE